MQRFNEWWRTRLPSNVEGYELCLYQIVFPTAVLFLIALGLLEHFSYEDTLKHLASGSPVLIATGLLISVYTVLTNRAAESHAAVLQVHGSATQLVLTAWRKQAAFILVMLLIFALCYIASFFEVMDLLGNKDDRLVTFAISQTQTIAVNSARLCATLEWFVISAAALGFSIRLTRQAYETFDRCFGPYLNR